MVDVEELKRKFPSKNGAKSRAAIRRIHDDYALRRAELGLDRSHGPKRGMRYYLIIIVVMMLVGAGIVGQLCAKKRPFVSSDQLKAERSVTALAIALGRYRFHTGSYPSLEAGLAALASTKVSAPGWFGPYVRNDDERIIPDPWGREYVYEFTADGLPRIYSRGPDGKAGTDDDIVAKSSCYELPFRDTSWTNNWMPYTLRRVIVAPNEAAKKAIEAQVKRYRTDAPQPAGGK